MFVHSGLQTLLCFVFHSQSVVNVIIINGNKKRNHPSGVDVQSLHLTGTVTVSVIKNICLCNLRMYMLLMYSLNNLLLTLIKKTKNFSSAGSRCHVCTLWFADFALLCFSQSVSCQCNYNQWQ